MDAPSMAHLSMKTRAKVARIRRESRLPRRVSSDYPRLVPAAIENEENKSMKSSTSLVIFAILSSLLVRYIVSRWPHSGQASPPMYGDYEAQRHWMEITVNLPPSQWYVNSTTNNLTYWGLDYPPLTAYHMQLNGKVAQSINSSWVKLNASYGIESYQHKLFMRSSVFLSDLLIFYPSLLAFYFFSGSTFNNNPAALTTVLFLPSLILVDHGHFQYNCVSLGLSLFAIYFLQSDNLALSAFMFSLALNYKQISLYYAMPFFMYMLSRVFSRKGLVGKAKLFSILALTVLVTFAICWLPFLSSINSMKAVFTRLFPVDRGLFEDKVANVWCPLEALLKLRMKFTKETLFKMSAIATLMSLLPSSVHLLFNGSIKNFKCALTISALAFFLFSYQVHEKGILFASLAGCLLVERHPLLSAWLAVVSSLSLMPLMVKDALVIPMLMVTLLFTSLFLAMYGNRMKIYFHQETLLSKVTAIALNASLYGHIVLMVALVFLKPPQKYPDLFTLIYSTWSCLHFLAFYVIIHALQFMDNFDPLEDALKKITKVSFKLYPLEPKESSSKSSSPSDSAKVKNGKTKVPKIQVSTYNNKKSN